MATLSNRFQFTLSPWLGIVLCVSASIGAVVAAGSDTGKGGAAAPKLMQWSAFQTKSGAKDETRNYNLFSRKFAKVEDPSDPKNWKVFDPKKFANQSKLVPNSFDSQVKVGSLSYPGDLTLSQDPSNSGAVFASDKPTIVYAHQGTPTVGGWLAPTAGFAYQIGSTIIFGTTDYTPINYHGKLDRVIDTSRVAVKIQSPSGAVVPSDLSRLFFNSDKRIVSQPHRKVYPSLVYLKPGEKVVIDGQPPVACPQPGISQTVSVTTDMGDKQDIKIICLPDQAVIPGTVTP